METMQEGIKKWAEKAVKQYVELAKNGFDYAFYTQSNLKDIEESPEYFICQINPGSGGKYTEQKSKDNWLLNGKDMDAEHFICGNYGVVDHKDGKPITAWERRYGWANFRRLKSLFSLIEGENPLDDVSKFVLTNATCFATPKTNDNIYKALEQTFPLTIGLADVVKPKRIIFLGSELPNYIKRIFGEDKCKIIESKLPRIKYGRINGYETLFIDHPSASTYKGDTKEVIRLWSTMPLEDAIKEAKEIRDKKPSAQKMSSPKNSQSKEKQLKLIDELRNGYETKGLVSFQDKPNDKKTIRFLLPKDLQITITATGKGYIAIRHTNYSGTKYSSNNDLFNSLQKFGFTHDYDVWIGCKPLNDFSDADSLFDLIKKIKSLLK